MRHLPQITEKGILVLPVHVGDGIPDLFIGPQVLRKHVHIVLGKNAVDVRQYARHILVNMEQPVRL